MKFEKKNSNNKKKEIDLSNYYTLQQESPKNEITSIIKHKIAIQSLLNEKDYQIRKFRYLLQYHFTDKRKLKNNSIRKIQKCYRDYISKKHHTRDLIIKLQQYYKEHLEWKKLTKKPNERYYSYLKNLMNNDASKVKLLIELIQITFRNKEDKKKRYLKLIIYLWRKQTKFLLFKKKKMQEMENNFTKTYMRLADSLFGDGVAPKSFQSEMTNMFNKIN